MKLVFISSISTPLMNKFCDELNNHCDATFIFYGEAVNRPKWWRNFIPSKKAKILEDTIKISNGKYYSKSLNKLLSDISPEVIIIGGMTIPSNYFAYKWAKRNKVKVALFSERFGGYASKLKIFQSFKYSLILKKFLKFLYKELDMIFAVNEIGFNDFINEFKFNKKLVIKTQYPVDMEEILQHKIKENRNNLNFLFPHRLIPTYNPLRAVDWFKAIAYEIPNAQLYINGFGALRGSVEKKIQEEVLKEKVFFIDKISSWSELPNIYKNADVMLSTKSAIQSDWSIAEMECAASGMGFIINNNSIGLVKFLKRNNSGFVVNSLDDIEKVVGYAKKYASSNNLLFDHGVKNKKNIEKYSLQKSAIRLINNLNSIK
tara:strand:+ start:9316 stop:10437 length:1122 start_codon:yes stop_codon:yes gene_type:complete